MFRKAFCRFAAIAVRLLFIALLSFAILLSVWTNGFASAIAPLETLFRELLPHGESWPWESASASSWNVFTPLQGDGWSAVLFWLDSTPWPSLILLLLLVIRIIVWWGIGSITAKLLTAKVNLAFRAGSLLESATFVFWVAVAAFSWRFWWGVNWDPPMRTAVIWFPTNTGPVHITFLCIGAALGYCWTIALFVRRSISQLPQPPHCANCGYLLLGLSSPGRCPECGHFESCHRHLSIFTRILNQLTSNAILIVGLVLLFAPYISVLAARLVT